MRAAAEALRRPFEGVRGLALELPPLWRRRLLCAAAALAALFALHLLWFRDSGLVSVDRVLITGVTTSDSARLRQALTASAETMTTLHVDRDRLEEVAASFPVVERLEVRADFPHTLRVHVVEHRPAALLVSGRSRVAVAADGTVLRGLPAAGALPQIALPGALPEERVPRGSALRAVRVAGAAPDPLRRRLATVRETRDRGVVARFRRGPELIFGDATRLAAKWAAAARVLADRGSRGASYVDLRLPERPAAGGLPAETLAPVAPAGEATAPPPAPGPDAPAAQAQPAAPAVPEATPAPASPAPAGPPPAAPVNPQP